MKLKERIIRALLWLAGLWQHKFSQPQGYVDPLGQDLKHSYHETTVRKK